MTPLQTAAIQHDEFLLKTSYQSPEAFKTLEQVRDYRSGTRIQCLVCGRYFQRIMYTHLLTHDLSPAEYRIRFGIPWMKSLTSVPSREKTRISCAMNTKYLLAKRKACVRVQPRERVPASKEKFFGNSHPARKFEHHAFVPCAKGCGAEVLVRKNSHSHKNGIDCDNCCSTQSLNWRHKYWIKHTGSYPPPHRQALLAAHLPKAA